ncbi:hypothetical protein VTN00DRAFT_6566 [Thermoascus crustaceus]|uniref:uncharacterized protein n=1 Tax=Thermoascus crustaceus TaxID=5088 RepID=UPI0037423D08
MITSQDLPQNSLTGLRGSIGHCLDQSEFTKMGRSLAVVIYAVRPLDGNGLLSSLGRLMTFRLDNYMGALVRFLDTIKYHDENYDRHQRVKILQYVYSETAKHFAQPLQQDALKVNPNRLAPIMRTAVQLVVYFWPKVSPQIMVALSIHFVYIVLLNDSSNDPHPDMASFCEDLLHGRQQKHPFWRLMNDRRLMNGHLSNFLSHYGSFCAFTIMRSTFDYFKGCWIEVHNFHGFPGSDYFPLFLRRLNSLGGVCGASLFPAGDFDEEALFDEVTAAIAQIEPQMAFVNDLISFYKEFDCLRHQVNLVSNYCEVEGISLEQAFDRLTEDTIHSSEQLVTVFDGKDPKVAATVQAFVHGYVTWHFCNQRYRMHEVYKRSGDSPVGVKFRQYYEEAMKVGAIDFKEWAVPPAMTNTFKESL